MILFGLIDSILLFVCQICQVNFETENRKKRKKVQQLNVKMYLPVHIRNPVVAGFKLTTSHSRVSPHNHWPRVKTANPL